MRIVVLFGAGASFGSGPVHPGRVPLGSELFDDLCKAYPQTWGSQIEDDEREAFLDEERPFERGMELLRERNDVRLAPLLRDMALFFARFAPMSPENQYAQLLQQISLNHTGSAAFASLNYDCMFEKTVAGLGGQVAYGPGDPPPNTVLVLKPHGSCNFIAPQTMQFIDVTFDDVGQYYVGALQAVDPGTLESIYAKGASIPPAISLYTTGKATLTGAGMITATRERWAEIASEAPVVISIGVRPVLADEHVWNPIIESSGDLWYVGGEVGDFADLSERLGGRLTTLAPYFEDAVPVIGRRLALLP